MTLLFFLRSPAGNTDAGKGPDAGPSWNYEELTRSRKKTRQERIRDREATFEMKRAFEEEIHKKRKKKRKEEEDLLLLLMHEFSGYDD